MSNKTQLQSNNAKFDENLELLKATAKGLTAEKVSYDNADSGMTAENVQAAIDEVKTGVDGKAPAYQYSTTDLTEGSSALATGTLYFVYE